MGARETIEAGRQYRFAASRLEQVFDRCFAVTLRTSLLGGAQEPLYLPASNSQEMHRLYYREDFFASALHEVAHWCIAGPQRRQQRDFGYWYAPDGRSIDQQRAFETVEIMPQALEWFFCKACNYRFRVSVDNLDSPGGELPDTGPFQRRVLEQAHRWQQGGLPERALMFFAGLCREFATANAPGKLHFALEELD